MVRDYLSGWLVGHISRDSTAISAREKPVNTKKDVAAKKKAKGKRGRPKKGEVRERKEPTLLQKQVSLSFAEGLCDLNTRCSWGCKKNSQAHLLQFESKSWFM